MERKMGNKKVMVAIIGDNIISPLGWTTAENHTAMFNQKTGLKEHHSAKLALTHHSGIVNETALNERFNGLANQHFYTKLEKACILSIKNALQQADIDPSLENVLFIISTTKGNIALLDAKFMPQINRERRYLPEMAKTISQFFNNKNEPLVISNACISGVLGIVTAQRFLEYEQYEHIVVLGCDEVSDFVLSGFNALKALSQKQCLPFDTDREGINLGDACGTIILSRTKKGHKINLLGGAITNDANHISGPSREGEGMFRAIKQSLESIKSETKIDYISAHGTATRFNDDMESIALDRHGLSNIPTNSLKGYWGHTLGAAGIIESIASYHSILQGNLIASKGFTTLGTTKYVNILQEPKKAEINCVLKTASGFGGCNASIIFKKEEGDGS